MSAPYKLSVSIDNYTMNITISDYALNIDWSASREEEPTQLEVI